MKNINYSSTRICKEINVLVRNYNSTINILDGLVFRQRDIIRMTEFYTNSRYLNGMKDELGRDKPFNNIINAVCDVENAAKDIDTADIQAISDDGNHYMESFLLSKELYEWMKQSYFSKTLNDMRDTHTRYGSLLVKKYMKPLPDGTSELCIEVPEWKNLITDQVDIVNRPIIECHYKTVTELMGMDGVWQNIDLAIAQAKSRGYATVIPVYEVRGMFPLSFYKEINGQTVSDGDENKFSYQLYYFAGRYGQQNNWNNQDANNMYNLGALTPLYWENNTEKVYKYLARKKRAGRAFGVGVPEEGQEAQVWTNDATLKQFRAMEITSKVIGQTASKKLKGRNMLTEVDDGQILEHDDNKPISALNLMPAGGLTQYAALMQQWFTQFERATSAYSAQRGESPTSRTSFKLQSAVIAQSGSVMETIQEEFGIFITEIISDWVMPYLAKRLNTAHILSHDFTMEELAQIDKNFSINMANQKAKAEILAGKIVTAEDYASFMQQADQMIKRTKATRFLSLPANYYKKAQSNVTILVTGEQRNKRAGLESLLSIFKIYQSNPDISNDPVLNTLLMQIIELSGAGISPITLIAAFQEKARQQAAAKAQGNRPSGKVAQSINFKDLPPDGQQQMAAEVGITIQPPAQPTAAGQPVAPSSPMTQ